MARDAGTAGREVTAPKQPLVWDGTTATGDGGVRYRVTWDRQRMMWLVWRAINMAHARDRCLFHGASAAAVPCAERDELAPLHSIT